jgi:hypothetical protein
VIRLVARNHHQRLAVATPSRRGDSAEVVDLLGGKGCAALALEIHFALRADRREERAEDDGVVVLVVARDLVAVFAQELDAARFRFDAHRGHLADASFSGWQRSRVDRQCRCALGALRVRLALTDVVVGTRVANGAYRSVERVVADRKITQAQDRVAPHDARGAQKKRG